MLLAYIQNLGASRGHRPLNLMHADRPYKCTLHSPKIASLSEEFSLIRGLAETMQNM